MTGAPGSVATVEAVARQLAAGDPVSLHRQAALFDAVAEVLVDLTDRFVTEVHRIDDAWSGGHRPDGAAHRGTAAILTLLRELQAIDLAPPLRRAGDALAGAQDRIAQLAVRPADQPGCSRSDRDAEALAILHTVASAYVDIGTALPDLPPTSAPGVPGATTPAPPVLVSPVPAGAAPSSADPLRAVPGAVAVLDGVVRPEGDVRLQALALVGGLPGRETEPPAPPPVGSGAGAGQSGMPMMPMGMGMSGPQAPVAAGRGRAASLGSDPDAWFELDDGWGVPGRRAPYEPPPDTHPGPVPSSGGRS